ncbi:MAG: hypothetical protein RL215_1179 [Planctomycetota bacterium]
MFEDRIAFPADFHGAERHGHFDLVNGPFLPGATVEPDFAVAEPVVVANLIAGENDGFEADAVSSVGVREVAGRVDLMGLQFAEEFDNDSDVVFSERFLLDTACFVKRQIEEAQVGRRNTAAASAGDGFAFPDESLDHLHLRTVDLTWLFASEEFFDVIFELTDIVGHQSECCAVVRDELGEAKSVIVEDGDIAGGLVGDVYIVSLISKSNEGSAHGDDIIIRVW